jgi:threonine/homoserine/homoserine lactone efflux protein
MPSTTTLLVFAVAAIALIVIPGPNLVYIVTRTVSQGRRAGFASALGVDAWTLVHIAAATAGLSAVIAHSPTAFAVVKYLGAAYLLYLGARTLLRRASDDATTPLAPEPLARAFRQGMLVNVLNPKVALFFLAFLPQFIEPERGSVALQTFILGLEFFALGLAMDLLYVTVAAALRSRVSGSGGPRGRYFTGAVYLGLAAFAAS